MKTILSYLTVLFTLVFQCASGILAQTCETAPPTIECPDNITVYADASCSAIVNYAVPTGLEACYTPTSTLTTGDIAFTGYNSDATDQFSFVLLRAVAAGTVIYFTDNGWRSSGGFRPGEGRLVWTTHSDLTCGTEVFIFMTGVPTTTVGAVTPGGGSFSLSTSGDQIFAYQGTAPTSGSDSTFLAAIQMNGGWDSNAISSNTSARPSVFTDGVNSISFSPERDNASYNCTTVFGDVTTLAAAANTSSNWTASNSFLTLLPPCGWFCNGSLPLTATRTSGLGSGSAFPAGTTVETYVVTASNGQTASCSFNVTVEDTLPPVAVCPNDTTIGVDQGSCQATFGYTATGTDNCTVGLNDTLLSGIASGGSFPLGATVNTIRVRDAAGNGADCSFSVTVIDNDPPALVCPNDTVIFSSGCTAVPTPFSYSTPEGTDACVPVLTSVLKTGDIAFTAYASDDPDEFMFVALTPIAAGTSINFTDNGWFAAGGFRSSEGTLEWTATHDVECGEHISINSGFGSSPTGLVTNVSGSFSLSSSGDQIFAYQGAPPVTGSESSFLAAIQMNGAWDADATNSNTSAKPTVFTDGVNSISFVPEIDNANYYCLGGDGTPDQIRSAVYNDTNWAVSNEYLILSVCNFQCRNSITVQTSGLGGGIYPPGTTVEAYEATDAAGNMSSCSFSVTITALDETPPALECPNDTVIFSASCELAPRLFNYDAPEGIDDCVPVLTSVLKTGDIAFTAYASDDPDEFMFVALTPIAAGTSINFTDNGWFAAGGFRSSEGTLEWTATHDVECGEHISINSGFGSSPTGLVTNVSGSFSLSSSGDQIFAYQGAPPVTGSESSFLAAIQMNGAWDADATNSNTSAKPAVFTDGINSISFTPEVDNANYYCLGGDGTPDQIRSAVYNDANWAISNEYLILSVCNFQCRNATTLQTSGLGSGIFPPGTTIETYEATDVAGNTSSCSFSVTVDLEIQTITEPGVLSHVPLGSLSQDTMYLQPANNDRFGQSVAALGLFNQDTIPDVAIGVPGDDEGGTSSGSVALIMMGDSGSVIDHLVIANGLGGFGGTLDPHDLFGTSVSNIGDLDNNGVTDLIVGAPGDDDGGNRDRGAAYILFLDSAGSVSVTRKISQTEGGFIGSIGKYDMFGSAVAGIGDLNNDGVEDVAVGAPLNNGTKADQGKLWILFLNVDGTVNSHQEIHNNNGGLGNVLSKLDRFGSAVEAIGDVNGDGITDLAVSAQGDSEGPNRAGAVYILFMNTDGTVASSQKIGGTSGGAAFSGVLAAHGGFGTEVSSLGDLDHDGVPDLLIGAGGDDDGTGYDRGAVYICYLHTDGTVKAYQKFGHGAGYFSGSVGHDVADVTPFEEFGHGLAVVGDLNGDCVVDAVIGVPGEKDGPGIPGGAIVCFLGDATGLPNAVPSPRFEEEEDEPQVDRNTTVISLFPNPTEGLLNLQIVAGMEGTYQVQVLDNIGRAVYLTDGIVVQGKTNNQLDLSSLGSGLYHVVVTNGVNILQQKVQVSR